MSFSDAVGPECGADNALMQLTRHFTKDVSHREMLQRREQGGRDLGGREQRAGTRRVVGPAARSQAAMLDGALDQLSISRGDGGWADEFSQFNPVMSASSEPMYEHAFAQVLVFPHSLTPIINRIQYCSHMILLSTDTADL